MGADDRLDRLGQLLERLVAEVLALEDLVAQARRSTLRCWFMTSSYLRTFLRISALRASTVFCAFSTDLVTIFDSSGTSSGNAFCITHAMAPVAKRRMSSSSSDR